MSTACETAAASSPRKEGPRPSAAPGDLVPPELQDPIEIRLDPHPDDYVIDMEPDRDYRIVFPDQPVTRSLVLSGGRNVVAIGGEIEIPHQGSNPSIEQRRALKIKDATGTVHVEGLLLHGADISEGIQIAAPRAVVQLQNIGVYDLRARDQVNFSDNHPDVIQTYGNVRELHIDGLTATSDYQGLFFKSDTGGTHGPISVRNVNLIGESTARYLVWFGAETGFGDVVLENVWVDVHADRDGGLGHSVWPPDWASPPHRATISTDDEGREIAFWPDMADPWVRGSVTEGRPPGRDFVPRDSVGIGYRR